ncbi:MAG: nitrilase family protein [Prevotella sp.]|nr:nitrilase family protein [Prevotella sp.]
MVSSINSELLYQMKISVIQLDIVWNNPLQNVSKVEKIINSHPKSDLYVLPEMWATGFATEPFGIAEDESGSYALKWMRSFATQQQCAICGSLAIRTHDGIYRNRHYFIDGCNKTEEYYDKHHLFKYGHEDRFYKSGEGHALVNYKGLNFLLLTCYDLRFPMWSRYSEKLQFDAIICVANWPLSRQNAWQILTRARAIENQAILIACNRVGKDNYCNYIGQSAVISPIGKTLVHCPSKKESIITVDIDLDMVNHYRQKFKVLDDRDVL